MIIIKVCIIMLWLLILGVKMDKQAIKHRLDMFEKNLEEIGFERIEKWLYGKGNIQIRFHPDNTFDLNIMQGEDMIISHKKYNITKIDGSDFILFFSDLRKFVVLFEKLFLKEQK